MGLHVGGLGIPGLQGLGELAPRRGLLFLGAVAMSDQEEQLGVTQVRAPTARLPGLRLLHGFERPVQVSPVLPLERDAEIGVDRRRLGRIEAHLRLRGRRRRALAAGSQRPDAESQRNEQGPRAPTRLPTGRPDAGG